VPLSGNTLAVDGDGADAERDDVSA
jgi:hypothetical protein